MNYSRISLNRRGFTLIELLVVIAIIGLLSTAIMGPVQTGLKKGRDTRKISDLTQIQGALVQYAGDNNGQYPDYLERLSPTYMALDMKMASSTSPKSSPARDRFMYVVYADAAGYMVQYHLGVALENQNASLQADADCGVRQEAATGVVFPSALDPLIANGWAEILGQRIDVNNVSCTTISDGSMLNWNWVPVGNPFSTGVVSDFGGAGTAEMATGVCTSKLDTCIFDIIPK